MDVERRPGRRGRVARGPAEDSGPVAEFARRLWELKRAAGDPSYDRMRDEYGALASKSALSAAPAGSGCPAGKRPGSSSACWPPGCSAATRTRSATNGAASGNARGTR
ncbi:hypothetical protein ACFWIW_09850 [Amycolatopsis sp. NPDC058340]|uniref:hypothetical protein n=1 Tax=Amycolatopsis sp. NPDC058340 TaxID=3346453 RepID=UPI00365677D0